MENYLETNKSSWNERAKLHYESSFYDNKSFIEGRNSLPELDIELLGDINNKTAIHLQCHFGQDTISLSRMGAKATGIDLSDEAITLARQLASDCQTDTKFICSDVYSLPEIIHEKFDICYSSYGTIGWLPDIKKWAEVVAHVTKSGGRFVFAEFHPVIWMYDDLLEHIQFSYFKDAAIEEVIEGTYASKDAKQTFKTISWNHGLSEVMQALIDQGFQIETFREYDYSPYNVFHKMKEIEPGKFIVEKFGRKMPLVYGLVARKK